MNDTMLIFLAALILAVILYYIVPLKGRWIVLLCVSIVFYIAISSYLAVYALGTALSVYFIALGVHRIYNPRRKEETPQSEGNIEELPPPADSGEKPRKPRKIRSAAEKAKRAAKALTATAIILNLAVLGFLKYFNFFGSSFCSLLSLMHVKVQFRALRLILPLGISFYTLQAIGYVIDVYRRKYEPERNFAKFLLFLIFFPQILEGPICRYDQTGKQLCEGHRAEYKRMAFAAQRILWGLFKKMIIADRVYLLVRTVSASPFDYSGLASLLFILGYTLQLYADFSGFIDIALGCGELFGITLPENFRRPFFASSAQEFWQRWHITLGTWLKEYVFYSVALSPNMLKFGKKIKKKHKNHFTKTLPTGIALLAVWFCNGLWHGPEWRYIVYGLYYFVIIFAGMLAQPLFAKMYEKIKLNPSCIGMKIFRHVRTLVIIFVGETIFGAPDLKSALHILGSVFVPYHGSIAALGLDWKEYIVLLCGVAVVFTVSLLSEKKIDVREGVGALALPVRWLLYILLVAVIVVFGAYGSTYTAVPFIYGGF